MPTTRKPAEGEASQHGGAGRRREPLSRERVLAAALELVDAEGVDALTMRRLARELGCNAMALYRYAASRGALLDGVVEAVMLDLVIPPDGADWEAQLRRTAHQFRDLALAHPYVVPLLVTRPLSTPLGLRPLGTVRPLEMLLTLLIDAGFSPEDALHVYRAYFGFLYGHVLTELQELVASPEESDDLLRLGLHRLPAAEFPYVRQLASALAGYDGVTELDQGLDILLTGLRVQLQIPARQN
ncbi:TetR family transcriptional regulator [Georgenia yuyongxinii]|uniref:TetR family transcriptional regulator n=1 Tax=Georgenia yuyongxinii TaxID=2589797 RepID=A0A5B8C043_9MICO|nr:TetR/AcrR family transcriptional regulator C-terminal domain-containing protein [Georgenia yuyongxinii]QDC23858.1 TetR family transcriptional regulator [Georgenia yuyongxinii]